MQQLLALELSDAGILVRSSSETPSDDTAESPGFALLESGALVVGSEARDRARLRPRLIHNRFWDRLGTEPLPRPFPTDLSSADLAHAHLEMLWKGLEGRAEAVILAVPGSHTPAQLGLILGIARACAMPVVGMVDAAVAASGQGYPGKHILHVDVHLHRAVVTEIVQDREIIRRRVESSGHVGLSLLHDRWVKAIAGLFVSNTRFDPLHVAETEQRLYGELSDLLARLCDQDSEPIELESAGKVHRVNVPRERVLQAAEADYDGIMQLVRCLTRVGRSSTILVSRRAATLPGLLDRLAQVGDSEVIPLEQGAAAAGALLHADAIRAPGDDEALPFVTRVPVQDRPARSRSVSTRARATSSARRGPPPTHVLHQGRAHPITEVPFALGIAIAAARRGLNLTGKTAGISRSHCSIYRSSGRTVVEDHSTHGSYLNGQRVEGKADLVVGDRLRLGSPGIELLLVLVAQDEPGEDNNDRGDDRGTS